MPPISAWISLSTLVPCCRPKTTSFCIWANSTLDVSFSSCSSCASVWASSVCWYFFLRRASRARFLSPLASICRAMSVSLSVRTVMRRWYWCSLSRWIFMSRMALMARPSRSALCRAQRGHEPAGERLLVLGGDLARVAAHGVVTTGAGASPAVVVRGAGGCLSRGVDIVIARAR